MHAACCPAGLQTARTALTPGLSATRSRQPTTRPRRATTVAQARTDVSRRDVLGFTAAGAALSLTGGALAEQSIYDFAPLQYGKPVELSKYKGKNLNYPGLRMLLEKYGPDGFEVLAFPCNQFGGQAPLGSEGEREYAFKKFGIDTFPVFDTIEVNGENADPLYKYLKAAQPDSVPGSRFNLNADIAWNYEKFICSREGIPIKRYKSPFNPADAEGDVRLALAGKAPLPEECVMHSGRSICKVEKYL